MNDAPETPQPVPSRRRFITWLWRLPVIAVLVGSLYGGWRAYRIIFSKRRPDPTPEFEAKPAQVVAGLDDFPKLWDSLDIVYEAIPVTIIRLPEAISGGISVEGIHFAAFSRVCTHQGCIVNFNRDLEAIALAFNHRTNKPALTCQCHFSVFEPSRAGKAVSGPAIEPLPRIQLTFERGHLIAVGVENVST